jgi:MFS superfamily sulfate permease-like transporter
MCKYCLYAYLITFIHPLSAAFFGGPRQHSSARHTMATETCYVLHNSLQLNIIMHYDFKLTASSLIHGIFSLYYEVS